MSPCEQDMSYRHCSAGSILSVWPGEYEKILPSLVGHFACSGDVGDSTKAAKAMNALAPCLRWVFPLPSTPSSTSKSNLVSSSVCEMSPVLCRCNRFKFLGVLFKFCSWVFPSIRGSSLQGARWIFWSPFLTWLHTEEDLWFSMSGHNGYRLFSESGTQKIWIPVQSNVLLRY